MNLSLSKVLEGLLALGYLVVHWNAHPCGLYQAFRSLFPDSVSNTGEGSPPPNCFSFQHSMRFLAWHLRSGAHPSPSESLLGKGGKGLLHPNVCLFIAVQGPSSHMLGRVSGGKGLLQPKIEVMWLPRVALQVVRVLFSFHGWRMLLLLHCTKWGEIKSKLTAG